MFLSSYVYMNICKNTEKLEGYTKPMAWHVSFEHPIADVIKKHKNIKKFTPYSYQYIR
jgi:hypothetical protein